MGTEAATFTLTDMSLYHHYMTSTAVSMYNDDMGLASPWVSAIPELATRCPYLLHEILAVSAIHLHHLRRQNRLDPDLPSASPGPAPEDYERLAQEHHARALRLFREALGRDTAAAQSGDLFACSALMMRFYFAVCKDPADLVFGGGADYDDGTGAGTGTTAPPSLPEWLPPIRGCGALANQFPDELRTGPIGQMLQTFAQRCDEVPLSQFSGPDPSPTPSPADDQLRLVTSRLQALAGPADQAVCGPALDKLRRCFAVAERGDLISVKTATFTFPSTVSNDFLRAACDRRRPAALVIMGYWVVLLNRMSTQWWLQGTSAAPGLLQVIQSSVPPQFADLLQWPVEQVFFPQFLSQEAMVDV